MKVLAPLIAGSVIAGSSIQALAEQIDDPQQWRAKRRGRQN
jgi:hypothetical protein